MNNPAAQTALGPMVIVAAKQYEPAPLIHDPWAQRLLPLSGRIAAALTRWSPARRAAIAATEKKFRGGWASILCRKRYIDDQLVNAVTKGVGAVVILGAGYDTRAYRLTGLAGIPVCEGDLPTNIVRKAAGPQVDPQAPSADIPGRAPQCSARISATCWDMQSLTSRSNVPRMPLALRAAGTPIASPATAHRCAPIRLGCYLMSRADCRNEVAESPVALTGLDLRESAIRSPSGQPAAAAGAANQLRRIVPRTGALHRFYARKRTDQPWSKSNSPSVNQKLGDSR